MKQFNSELSMREYYKPSKNMYFFQDDDVKLNFNYNSDAGIEIESGALFSLNLKTNGDLIVDGGIYAMDISANTIESGYEIDAEVISANTVYSKSIYSGKIMTVKGEGD
jgi:hypothetical protein